MPKRFAVSHINFQDNELTTQIVTAADWKTAAMSHEKIAEMFPPEEGEEGDDDYEEGNPIPDTPEEAKEAASDNDCAIEIVEIPDVKA